MHVVPLQESKLLIPPPISICMCADHDLFCIPRTPVENALVIDTAV